LWLRTRIYYVQPLDAKLLYRLADSALAPAEVAWHLVDGEGGHIAGGAGLDGPSKGITLCVSRDGL